MDSLLGIVSRQSGHLNPNFSIQNRSILLIFQYICSNEPVSDTALQFLADSEKEHHRKIIANIVQQIKPRVKELHELLVNPPTVSVANSTGTN